MPANPHPDRLGRGTTHTPDASGYNVVVSNELLALKPNNVIVVVQGEPVPAAAAAARQADAGRAQGGGAGPGFQLPAGLDPKHLAMAAAAVLVMGCRRLCSPRALLPLPSPLLPPPPPPPPLPLPLPQLPHLPRCGVPLLTAGLLSGLGLLGHSAARREGGLLPALRMCARRAQGGLERLTGRPASTAQAAFVLLALAALVWWYMLAGGDAAGGASSGGYGGGAYGGGARGQGGARRAEQSRGYEASRGSSSYDSGSYSGLGSGVDLSFLLGVGMLSMTVWNMGGGGRPDGWSLGTLTHKLQNMDLWQMMMLFNLLQQVLGGGRRRGGGGFGGGGFGRRYY